MSHAQAAHYRRRAAHLRTLAHQMQTTPSMSLQTHSTVDTWHGPCAQRCNDELARAQRAVHAATDELAVRAWRVDRTADDLEAAAVHAERVAAAAAAERARAAASATPD